MPIDSEGRDTRQAPQAAAAEEWQSIKTAPKDGTAVLAAFPDSDLPHSVRYGESGWEVAWDGHVLSGYDQPTHWMPLPDAPGAPKA
jgi:hypothetical protein